jgi:hypothetical protein
MQRGLVLDEPEGLERVRPNLSKAKKGLHIRRQTTDVGLDAACHCQSATWRDGQGSHHARH